MQQTLPPHPFKTTSFSLLFVVLVKEQWPYRGAAFVPPLGGGRRTAPLLKSTQRLNGFQAHWSWQEKGPNIDLCTGKPVGSIESAIGGRATLFECLVVTYSFANSCGSPG